MADASTRPAELREQRTTAGLEEASGSADGIGALASGWLTATRERARAISRLAIAEARLAAHSVALMAFLGMLTAVCLLGSWGMLLAALVYGLHQAGLALWAALLLVAAANIVAAYLLWRTALGLSRHLEFNATRAQLQKEPEASP